MSDETIAVASAAVARIRRLVDEGKVDDPLVIAFVRSIEERLDADEADEITAAQLERLVELSEDLLGRLGHERGTADVPDARKRHES